MRAIRCRYDPFIQTRTHSVDKVEFVVMGGTFLSLEQSYQDEFIMKLHDALSGHHSHSVEEAVKYVMIVYINECGMCTNEQIW